MLWTICPICGCKATKNLWDEEGYKCPYCGWIEFPLTDRGRRIK
jgi:anaerobic ribonucleoside-triphosphate reductase